MLLVALVPSEGNRPWRTVNVWAGAECHGHHDGKGKPVRRTERGGCRRLARSEMHGWRAGSDEHVEKCDAEDEWGNQISVLELSSSLMTGNEISCMR